MTDKESLGAYRWQEAQETLADAERMLQAGLSPRSIINRAYYAMFYATWALLLHKGIAIKTSKHTGMISLFDREFVLTGIMDGRYSKIMHNLFLARQEHDYKEMVTSSPETAAQQVQYAKEFLSRVAEVLR